MSKIEIIENTADRIEVCVHGNGCEADQIRFVFTREGLGMNTIVNDEVQDTYAEEYWQLEERINGDIC